MIQVAVHLVSDDGYVHAYRVAVDRVTSWLGAAQAAYPELGVTVMSVAESDRTEFEDMKRNASLQRMRGLSHA